MVATAANNCDNSTHHECFLRIACEVWVETPPGRGKACGDDPGTGMRRGILSATTRSWAPALVPHCSCSICVRSERIPILGLHSSYSCRLSRFLLRVFLLDREPRARLTAEFLRPFSRPQLLRAVGLTALQALARFVLLAVAIPGFVLWLRGGLSPVDRMIAFVLAVVVWLPAFLGSALAKFDEIEFTLSVSLCLVLYVVFLWLFAADDGGMEPSQIGPVCALILGAGLLNLLFAYRTWLDRDPEEGRIS